ncbi:unnamed protein product, partial [Rotaria magnacalcarata]
MFSSTYLKAVIVSGKPTETDLSSIVTHTNQIGLRQHLASNNKILLNDDADLIAESYGLYNVNDSTNEHERNIILSTFQQTTVVSGGDEQTQTQYDRSAMFTVWNLIADLIEIQDLKPNEQQQILDFYAKAGAIFPRIACLMQLYFNAAEIFERLKHKVIFVEGDSQDLVVNENFVSSVANIIKIDYHVYDNSYLPYMEINQVAMDPIVIVKKEAVIAAWK